MAIFQYQGRSVGPLEVTDAPVDPTQTGPGRCSQVIKKRFQYQARSVGSVEFADDSSYEWHRQHPIPVLRKRRANEGWFCGQVDDRGTYDTSTEFLAQHPIPVLRKLRAREGWIARHVDDVAAYDTSYEWYVQQPIPVLRKRKGLDAAAYVAQDYQVTMTWFQASTEQTIVHTYQYQSGAMPVETPAVRR